MMLKGSFRHFMNEVFGSDELLLRAVYPQSKRPDFWNNGHLTSAALKDAKGLSVDRTGLRTLSDSIEYTKAHLQGYIVSISVVACNTINAKLRYLPSKKNPFHSEIHGSETEIELSDVQAYLLSRQAQIVFESEYTIV